MRAGAADRPIPAGWPLVKKPPQAAVGAGSAK